MESWIKVGYGKVDITPQPGTPIGGYGNDSHRLSTDIRDVPFVTCVAFTDKDDNTVLICSVDMIHMEADMTAWAREAMEAATGVPGDHIVISAVHTHTCVSTSSRHLPGETEFLQWMCKERLPKAAKLAMETRSDARLYAGKAVFPRTNFTRHFKLADGRLTGRGFAPASEYVDHSHPGDCQMQIVKVTREEGKDIVLMNWQTHPDTMGGGTTTAISADYVGVVRSYMEISLDCEFAYFQGACGDLVPNSRRFKDRWPIVPTVPYGKRLGDQAMSIMENLTEVQPGPVDCRMRHVTCPVDHSEDHLLPKAKEAWALYNEQGLAAEADAKAKEFGWLNRYTARGIVFRAAEQQEYVLEVDALRVGGIGFATAPYEMFSENGMWVKDNSPYDFTFMLTSANGDTSYIASEVAYTYPCYEVQSRLFPKGTGEMLATNMLEMLKEMQ